MPRANIIFRSISGMKLLSQRRARIRIGAMIEQQLRERRDLGLIAVVHPEIRLRDDRAEKRRMTAKTILVNAVLTLL